MLFSKRTGCVSRRLSYPRNGDFDRRDILRAGGTGFGCGAFVATLTGASKNKASVRHKPLGAAPQVDRLVARIVTDNYVFFDTPRRSQKT